VNAAASLFDQPGARGWYANPFARRWVCPAPPNEVRAFHAGLPSAHPTPLTEVPGLAAELGVRRAFVKDESSRLGLPAFKGLGVSYAVYRVLSELAGERIRPATVDGVRDRLASLPRVELVTATDGNHGRALARFARLLGLAARVYVPEASAARVAPAIADEGAKVTTVPASYDEAVRRAADSAAGRASAVLVQDTAWPGYELVPRWIVDGYATLFAEVDEQLRAEGEAGPDLMVVPMGVGSLAQAAVTHYRSRRSDRPAAILGVEPDAAAGVLTSLRAGTLSRVDTAATIMDGLNCGTPSMLAWPYLRAGLDAAVTVSDSEAVAAVPDLAAAGVTSGPCGAASLAAARAVLGGHPTPGDTAAAPGRRRALGVDARSAVVLLSTEGTAASPCSLPR